MKRRIRAYTLDHLCWVAKNRYPYNISDKERAKRFRAETPDKNKAP